MLMRQPGAERRISPAHESIVLPVVNTSSTSRTCRPASRPGRPTANASSVSATSADGEGVWTAQLRR